MTITLDPQACLDAALKLARGHYQRDVLFGRETLSGAGLQGRAAEYGARYKESRCGLLTRCKRAGLPFCFVRPEGGGATELAWGLDAVLVAAEGRCASLSGLPVWTHAELVALLSPEVLASLTEEQRARIVLTALAEVA